mgnify:CR=1 FL=1|tara:strand:+ start:163 stop:507 length:345 start_codon:yes stop_codon:yes gene_type:complete
MAQSSAKSGRISPLWIIPALVWILPLGTFFLTRWEQDLAPVEHTYVLREQTCKARYRDQEAQDRCLAIMRLEQFQSSSIMVANRVLACAAPPLIGFAVLVYLRRRRSRRKGLPK